MIIKSLDQLNSLSKKVANHLEESDCIYLIGEIGVGKTTFTRYLINYLQEKEGLKMTEIPSPTFNLLYEYDFKKFKIMHYDLFRIKKKKELQNLGLFFDEKKEVNIIEWPILLKTPKLSKLEIYMNFTKNSSERKINFKGTGKWKNFK